MKNILCTICMRSGSVGLKNKHLVTLKRKPLMYHTIDFINSLKIFKADLSIAVTGIAGPTGGSIYKPVGLVWIAIGTKQKIITNKYQFNGNRLEVRQKTTYESLKATNKMILEL